MGLFSRLFPKAVELEKASKRIEVLEADRAEQTRRYSRLWESYCTLDATVQQQRTEIALLKGKLREQTDADLLLVSARIMIATLKGEKPAASDIALQQSLHAQQQSMQQSPLGAYGGSIANSLAQQLGLGNVFGR